MCLYRQSFLSFCCHQSFQEKKKNKKNPHPAWSNSVSRAVVYTILWICCDCTVLYLTITGNNMVLCVCPGLHTFTHTHRHAHNPWFPVLYCKELIQMHSHRLCLQYLWIVNSFFLILWQCISENLLFELLCKQAVSELFLFNFFLYL